MTECCDETVVSNIKQDLVNGNALGRRYRSFRFDSIQNPIPAQIEDADEYKRFFNAFPDVFIPYSGTEKITSHSLLAFLLSLSELSPTQSGVIQAKKRYAFGGKVQVIRREDKDFDLGETPEATDAERKTFLEFLKRIEIYDNSEQQISVRDLAKYQLEDDEACGNVYFEMVRSEFGGERLFKVFTHRPVHCLYVATQKNEPRLIAVSPIWSSDYLVRHGFDVLPVYPNWRRDSDGVERTMVHVKNGNYPWYGRPLSMASMLDQFFEFQNADYKSKQTATQFVGQALIEVEDNNPQMGAFSDTGAQENGFSDTVDEFSQNFTNESPNPQRVLLMTRPYGAKEAFVFQFQPNTQEGWFRSTGEDAETNILKSHGFPKQLITFDSAVGIGGNVFLEVFEIYDSTINQDIQTEFAANINDIIVREAAEFLEQPEMLDFGVKFQSPFTKLLENRRNVATNNINGVGSSPVQPGEQ